MTVSILEQYEDMFTISSLVLDACRLIGWWLIRGLAFLLEASEKALYEIFSLQGFFQDSKVLDFFSSLRPTIWIILSLSLGFIGLQYILGKIEDSKKIIQNFVFAIIIVCALPMFMSMASDLTFAAVGDMQNQPGEYYSMDILRENITDILLYDEDGFSTDLRVVNNLSPESASRINPNEVIKPDDAKNKDVFEHRLTYTSSGTAALVELEQGFLDVFKEYYYRYKINWGTLIVTLSMVTFSLLMTCIKVARLLYELAFHQLFASLLAFCDLMSGQRLKKVLSAIVANFSVIALTPILLQLYLLGCSYAKSVASGFVYVLMLIPISFALIDGPNIIQSVLGVDAGISSSFKTMAGLFYGAKTAGLALKAGGNLIGAGARLAGKTAAGGVTAGFGAAGIVRGMHEAMQDNPYSNQQNASPLRMPIEKGLPSGSYAQLGEGTPGGALSVIEPGLPPHDIADIHPPSVQSTLGTPTGSIPTEPQPPKQKPIDVERTTPPPAAASAPTPHTGTATIPTADSTPPNQYQSLGGYAVGQLKERAQNSSLYQRSQRAYTIGYNAAYGATDRTLKKMDADIERRGIHYPMPPMQPLQWQEASPGTQPPPESNSIPISPAPSLSYHVEYVSPQPLLTGGNEHAISDSRRNP